MEKSGLEQRGSRQGRAAWAWGQNTCMASCLCFTSCALDKFHFCFDLNVNVVPYRPSCLKIWSPAGDAVWKGAESFLFSDFFF